MQKSDGLDAMMKRPVCDLGIDVFVGIAGIL
jgi:hypothetical protein